MSHAHEPHEPGHATHGGDRPYFPAAEWEEFQKEDIGVGKVIVLLMSGIFTIGLILYTTIAIIVGSG